MAVVTHITIEKFQEQYGTLWNATIAYLEGTMHPLQAAAFENVVKADFLAAVAQTRLLQELVQWAKQA
jgi:hypothetical protein